ncbi:hypothetical protein PR048_022538 [Dryococelus australis]|uniref:Uncharacterized protein n=1 Tax=Dryococelus australis TaxID=614101 RepID=A0ABQ9H1D0_9NEOP|nr:hypothetical protein PR048_022538 [Dryococelus australis]
MTSRRDKRAPRGGGGRNHVRVGGAQCRIGSAQRWACARRVCRVARSRCSLANDKVIEVSMKQRWNVSAGEMGDPRENPLTSGIVRHDSHM